MDLFQEIKSAIIKGDKISQCSQENVTSVIASAINDVMNLRGQNFDPNRLGGGSSVTLRFMNNSLREMLYIGEIDIALTQGCLNNPTEFPSPAIYIRWLKEYSRSEIREKARTEVDDERKQMQGTYKDDIDTINYLINFDNEYRRIGRRGAVESCDAAVYDQLVERHIIKQTPTEGVLRAMAKGYIPDPTSKIGKIYLEFKDEKARLRSQLEKGKSVALFNFLDALRYDNVTLKDLLTA